MIWKHNEGSYFRWGLNFGGGKYYARLALMLPLPWLRQQDISDGSEDSIGHPVLHILNVLFLIEYGFMKGALFPTGYAKVFRLRRMCFYTPCITWGNIRRQNLDKWADTCHSTWHIEEGYRVLCDRTGRAIVIEADSSAWMRGNVRHLRPFLGTFPYGRLPEPDVKQGWGDPKERAVLVMVIAFFIASAATLILRYLTR